MPKTQAELSAAFRARKRASGLKTVRCDVHPSNEEDLRRCAELLNEGREGAAMLRKLLADFRKNEATGHKS